MGEAHGPAAAEERELLGVDEGGVELLGDRAARASAIAASRSSPSEARKSASAVVANRVCTTERSSANGRVTDSSTRPTSGEVGVADDADGAHATAQALDELEHLGRGARAGQRDDGVVAAVDEGLGCRERVGLAVAARLRAATRTTAR